MSGDAGYPTRHRQFFYETGGSVSTSHAAGLRVYAAKAGQKRVGEQTRAVVRPTVEPDDETLLLRIQTSDMSALGLLFHRYSHLMLEIARRVLRDDEEAKDLVQDVFLFLFLKSKTFDPEKGSARSWLIQVTYHRAYDRRRYLRVRSFYDRVRANDAIESLASPVNPKIENPEQFFTWQSYLQTAFDGLSQNQRRTLTLYFYEGHTVREISEKLKQPFGNVQHHYYRGMNRLREYVRGETGK